MAKHLELTPRLGLLASWVRPGAKLADVGTDHAYLPVWLMLHGGVSSAIASDLRVRPLPPGPGERRGLGCCRPAGFAAVRRSFRHWAGGVRQAIRN
ncbi:MAG: tRNA (adenine(22)-N(1))-methyltransferase TrmK [Dysosmobacter sp.]